MQDQLYASVALAISVVSSTAYHLCATLVIRTSSGIYTECVALHTSTIKGLHPVTQRYDTDSRTLIIDNGCSASITNDWKDFF
jgi:hypothetical protein